MDAGIVYNGWMEGGVGGGVGAGAGARNRMTKSRQTEDITTVIDVDLFQI